MVGAAHNLPYQTSSFVGRQKELAKLREWLVASRLVTLVGAGGGGKTRLALELARDCLPHYPEGVRLVDLSPLSDRALVAQTLAGTLDIHEEIGRDWIDTLVSKLRAARLLVLLDNCEHLRPAAAEVIHALLSGCGSLQVLATSREPLNLPGESIFRVPPLAVQEAVELFAVRARQAGSLDEGQPEVVEEHDNVRAALDWCHQHEPGWELRMALTLFAFWSSRGFVAEGRRRFAGILANFPDPNLDRALALSASGRLAARQNDFEAAEASLQEALVIQRRLGNPRGVARAQHELGFELTHELRYDEARPLLEEAVASARATGEPSMLAAALHDYGFLAAATDDPAGARLILTECVAIRRQLGQRYRGAIALLYLGHVLVLLGELDQAEQALDEALAVLREVEDLAGLAVALLIVSAIAARRGLGQRAAVLKGAAHQLGGRSGSSVPPWRELWSADIEAADPGDLVSDLDRLVATATDGRVAPAAPRPKSPQLSGREAQVAGLVAEGLSNRKIGVALHLSERTVETHVQHILNKLAFHSRSQIAAWVAGRTVGSPDPMTRPSRGPLDIPQSLPRRRRTP